MFTGLITDVGKIISRSGTGDVRIVLQTGYEMHTVPLGASIACNGICLTVVDKGEDWFAADVSQVSQDVTTAGDWQEGRLINLERSLRLGDEMGGHIVSGHVDCVGEIMGFERLQGDTPSIRLTVRAPGQYAHLLVAKGSVTVDGVSLTVNSVEDSSAGCDVTINLIPHTQSVTAFRESRVGDKVNLEFDLMARYVARMRALDAESQ